MRLARPLVRVLKRVLARFGFFVGRYPAVNTLDSHLLQVFSILQINCVLDVGAHKGDYTEALRDLGYKKHIVSVEPVLENFQQLSARFGADARWRGAHLALGSVSGEATMNIFAGSTFDSLLPPSDFGVEHFPDKMIVDRHEVVPIRRLDELWDEFMRGIESPRVMLKLDTQGYDLIVIEGAGERLADVEVIQIELSLKPIYEGMSNDLLPALSHLRTLGFELTGFFPVVYDPMDPLTVVEVDCVLCRAPHRIPRRTAMNGTAALMRGALRAFDAA